MSVGLCTVRDDHRIERERLIFFAAPKSSRRPRSIAVVDLVLLAPQPLGSLAATILVFRTTPIGAVVAFPRPALFGLLRTRLWVELDAVGRTAA